MSRTMRSLIRLSNQDYKAFPNAEDRSFCYKRCCPRSLSPPSLERLVRIVIAERGLLVNHSELHSDSLERIARLNVVSESVRFERADFSMMNKHALVNLLKGVRHHIKLEKVKNISIFFSAMRIARESVAMERCQLHHRRPQRLFCHRSELEEYLTFDLSLSDQDNRAVSRCITTTCICIKDPPILLIRETPLYFQDVCVLTTTFSYISQLVVEDLDERFNIDTGWIEILKKKMKEADSKLKQVLLRSKQGGKFQIDAAENTSMYWVPLFFGLPSPNYIFPDLVGNLPNL